MGQILTANNNVVLWRSPADVAPIYSVLINILWADAQQACETSTRQPSAEGTSFWYASTMGGGGRLERKRGGGGTGKRYHPEVRRAPLFFGWERSRTSCYCAKIKISLPLAYPLFIIVLLSGKEGRKRRVRNNIVTRSRMNDRTIASHNQPYTLKHIHDILYINVVFIALLAFCEKQIYGFLASYPRPLRASWFRKAHYAQAADHTGLVEPLICGVSHHPRRVVGGKNNKLSALTARNCFLSHIHRDVCCLQKLITTPPVL